MQSDILSTNPSAEDQLAMQKCLSHCFDVCTSIASNYAYPAEERNLFSDRADKLLAKISWLSKNIVETDATQLTQDANDLAANVVQIDQMVQQLVNLEKTLETLNDILTIVDQSLAIAAGVAKF